MTTDQLTLTALLEAPADVPAVVCADDGERITYDQLAADVLACGVSVGPSRRGA